MNSFITVFYDWSRIVTAPLAWAGPLLVRLVVGWVFLWTGWQKLQILPRMVENFRSWGIPAPEITTPFVSGLEFVGGLLLLLGLLTAWTLLLSRKLFAALALLQLALFTLTWMPASPTLASTAPQPFAIAVAGVSTVLILVLGATALFPSPSLSFSPSLRLRFRLSLSLTTLTPAVLAVFAILLFLRKPYALLVPQLYAEDGTIFLAQNDLVGLRAFLEPYMGYLHTLPRLIAWTASRLLDPAWWPAFYNVTAFALWLAVIARTFSPRLPRSVLGSPSLFFSARKPARSSSVSPISSGSSPFC